MNLVFELRPSQVGAGYFDAFILDHGKSLGVPYLVEPYMIETEAKMLETLQKIADWFNLILRNVGKGDPALGGTDQETKEAKFARLFEERIYFDVNDWEVKVKPHGEVS